MKSRGKCDRLNRESYFPEKDPTWEGAAEEAFCDGLDLLRASSEIQPFHRIKSITGNVEQFGSSTFECRAFGIRIPGSGPSSLGPFLGFVSAPRQGQEAESHREDQRGNAAEPTTLRWPPSLSI